MALQDLLIIITAVVTAFSISYVSMPAIIKIAGLKHLIDAPDGKRKLHGKATPTLGGIGIISAFIISFSVWGQAAELVSYPYFIAALFMLFLIGLKDDILVLSWMSKIVVQAAAAILIVAGGGVLLTDFGGLFGLGQIPWLAGMIISVLIMVAIVNSFNLIDGIDGLAGGIGIIASTILGIWFWGAGFLSLAILSFALSGALMGFLTFNMHPAKIFMGDTGAMVVGFILGFLVLEFIALNSTIASEGWYVANGHVFAVAILIIPVVNTLRVVLLRILQGKSLFIADRNHIHYKLIDIGMPPLLATFSLWLANIFVIVVAYGMSHFETNIQLSVILILGMMILPTIIVLFLYSSGLRTAYEKNKKRKALDLD